jgi:hypothetical protein
MAVLSKVLQELLSGTHGWGHIVRNTLKRKIRLEGAGQTAHEEDVEVAKEDYISCIEKEEALFCLV